jgi:hypothetical protein
MLDFSWTASDIEGSPSLSLKLSPLAGGAEIPLSPVNIAAGAPGLTTASSDTSGVPSGYYALEMVLSDGQQQVGGRADIVRILQDQDTLGSGTISITRRVGSLSTTITPELQNPLEVTLSRSSSAFTDESLLNFCASATGITTTASYSWYLNGRAATGTAVSSGSTLSLANNLTKGFYRVDALAYASSRAGDASFEFYWQGQLAGPPTGSPQQGWAYFDTVTGLPYLWDSGMWQVFSTVPVHTASLTGDQVAFESTVGLSWDLGPNPLQGPPVAGQIGAPGFGSTSFFSNVLASDSSRKYTALRISPKVLLKRAEITMEQLKSVSFFSKQELSGVRIWQLKIYTVNEAFPEVPDAWYKTRFNTKLNKPTNTTGWMLNSTSAAINPDISLVFDNVANKDAQGVATTTSLATPKDLVEISASHESEKILFVDIIAGDNSSSNTISCYLDGVVIRLKDGSAAVLDLGD